MNKGGRPRGRKQNEQISLRISEDLLKRLDALAEAEQRSRSNLILKLLEDELSVRESQGAYPASRSKK